MKRATLIALVLAAAAPPDAHAYVRSTTSANVPTAWGKLVIPVELNVGEPPPLLDRTTLVAAVRAAAAAWSKPAVACTGLELVVSELEESFAPAANDGRNRIGFRRDEWRKMPCTVTAKEKCAPYDSLAIAITTVTSNTRTGEIYDADMEINAVNHRFDDVTVPDDTHNGVTNLQDLQNTLTHELGHLIGLDHTCYVPHPQLRAVPKDDRGQEAPLCTSASEAIADTTMFARASTRETKKRDLAPDDVAGVCGVYPPDYRGFPPEPEEGGCAIASSGGAPGGFAAFGVTGLALALALRRRTRHGARSPRSVSGAPGRAASGPRWRARARCERCARRARCGPRPAAPR